MGFFCMNELCNKRLCNRCVVAIDWQVDVPVLDWGRGVEGVAGCLWGCWRAEDDGWIQSDERMTAELKQRKIYIVDNVKKTQVTKSIHSKKFLLNAYHTSPAEGLAVLHSDQGTVGLGDPVSVGDLLIRAFVVHPGA